VTAADGFPGFSPLPDDRFIDFVRFSGLPATGELVSGVAAL
jgi:hypothetical protein